MSFRYIVAFAFCFSMTTAAFGQQTGEVVKEETVQSQDASGNLAVSQRTVTHESTVNGSNQIVTETYSSFVPGVALEYDGPLELAQRVRVTNTPTVDGGRQTITETEARVPAVTNVVMQLVSREVETVRQIEPGVWETERQTFGLDGNGRLVLATDEKETAVER
jgi:hypothetical protein